MTEPFAFPTLDPEGGLVTVAGATPATRAAEIVQQAHVEARRIAAAAEEEGRRAGFAAGLDAAQAELGEARQVLEEAATTLLAEREAFVERAERRAVELALLLAEKIVGASLAAQPELVLSVVAGALRRVVDRDRLVLEVNPADHDLVRGSIDDVAMRVGGVHQLEVIPEPRVARGGCVLRTQEGEIDARVSEQLERAEELLRDALAAGHADA